MSCSSRAWAVAASVGAVEALKDQGFCRWNYAFRLLQQQANTNLRSCIQSKKLSPRQQNQSEESIRTVMYLSSWAPN
ncbi:Wound-responsive family protein [Salvia divinorum]|uniref:Wound-responsive family protein n=1 Tax=Salvia divinorum TaxID=28513 RepID=A0ABD1I862_SALDI